MPKRKKIISAALLLTTALAVSVGTFSPSLTTFAKNTGAAAASGDSPCSSSAISSWTDAEQYRNSWSLNWSDAKIDGQEAHVENGQITLLPNAVLSFEVPVQQAGTYTIAVRYYPKDALYMDCLIHLAADGTEYTAALPLLWTDAHAVYGTDRKGNELIPEQTSIEEPYLDILRDYQDTNKDALTLEWKPGVHKITFSSQSQAMMITEIYVNQTTALPTYSEYAAAHAGKTDAAVMKTVEAERYMVKSDSFIRATSRKNAALYPYDTYRKLLNVLEEGAWSSAGQKILWEFEADEDGYYQLGLRYLQNSEANKPVYRTIEIDGAVPFAEWETVVFENTKTGKYDNKLLEINGEPAKIYLTAGKHTLAMRVSMGPLEEVYNDILALMEDINAFGMDIQKLTAGQVDQNRTWNMEYYLPNAVPDLLAFADRIDALYDRLEKISGSTPAYADNLKFASETLRKLTQKPNQIPNKIDLINQGDNSATKYLGNVLETLNIMPLSIDRFYIGDTTEMPAPNASFFTNVAEAVKSFIYSFTADAKESDYTAVGAGKNKELTVWINRSVPYVQVLQQIIDTDYNAKYGTNIQLSIMPSEQKLILSNATQNNPDVVLSAGIGTPFNFAIRGAAKNLLEYEDFLTFYNENYNLESLVPASFGEGVYGAAESQDFYVLFYRKDIFETLKLTVPDTWEDVKTMMPSLLRYGMNFNIPLSGSAAYKGFGTTSQFVFQNKGSYVSDNGTTSAFTTDAFLDAMTEMTELYEIYGMSSAVPSFYNSFRNGEIPIGIATFSTYIQLQMAAPELAGKWAIAPAPGTKQEDGTVLRYQPASSTACMIFENTQKSEEAWQFLKWWLSTDTQVRYAYMMQSTYGTEYRWNTANLTAFSQMSYSEADKAVILEQWKSQKEITNHPANYMIERQTSDIWNGVVVDHESMVEEIDRATLATNRELIRKLKEFGFCDDDGNVIRDYSMKAYEMLQQKLAEAQAKEGGGK